MPWQRTLDASTTDSLAEFATRFELVLNSSPGEEAVQTCVETCPDVFGFLSIFGLVLPKFRLSEKFVPDFLIVGIPPWSQSHTPTVTMVELELPSMPLFTRAGDQSSGLTHALRQVQDWKRWTRENYSYLRAELARRLLLEPRPPADSTQAGVVGHVSDALSRSPLPLEADLQQRLAHGFGQQYVVIGGRRAALTLEQRLRLEDLNRESHSEADIITYDLLLDFARNRHPLLHDSS